jgi:hypothetical protein
MALRGEDDIFDEYAPRGLNPDRWVQHPSYADKPFVSQYLQSLFWAVEVTTGIGDDIVPKEDGEVLFTAIVAVIGLIIYSVIIGSASSALQNMDSAGAARRQTLDKVTDYLRYRKVPRFFQKIILDYYEHVHSNVSDKDDGFLEDLPPTLRVRLSLILNRDLVAKVPIFSNFTADVLIRLIQRLVSEMYLPGEYIVKAGEYGDSMHFIKSGKVDVIAPDERTVRLCVFNWQPMWIKSSTVTPYLMLKRKGAAQNKGRGLLRAVCNMLCLRVVCLCLNDRLPILAPLTDCVSFVCLFCVLSGSVPCFPSPLPSLLFLVDRDTQNGRVFRRASSHGPAGRTVEEKCDYSGRRLLRAVDPYEARL